MNHDGNEPDGVCPCGRVMFVARNAAGERIGVTHTPEDEDHHLEYWRPQPAEQLSLYRAFVESCDRGSPITINREHLLLLLQHARADLDRRTVELLRRITEERDANIESHNIGEECCEWCDAAALLRELEARS